MDADFDFENKYFTQITTDGKVKIWNTLSNNLEQEFTPDFHLTSPCTCLHYTHEVSKNGSSPRKKKKRDSGSLFNLDSKNIVFGTKSGCLLVYSIAKGEVELTIDSKSNLSISCLSSCDGNIFYSGCDQSIFVWNLKRKTVQSTWKAGNEKISAILVLPKGENLVTASRRIKLWSIESQEVLQIFTGHNSDVTCLRVISTLSGSKYLFSGSNGDRIISCWNLSEDSSEQNAVANFVTEDGVTNLKCTLSEDGDCKILAIVRSGQLQIYQHTLNGKSSKPLKAKYTVQVVFDSNQKDDVVQPIPIVGAVFKDATTLGIAHGHSLLLNFENLETTELQKYHVLIRTDPKLSYVKEKQSSKSSLAVDSTKVHYVTPQSSAGTAKRKSGGAVELPMEKRLENLTLNKLDSDSKVPKSDNVAQLLLQALHSKDKYMLKSVLIRREDSVISNTIKRLPMDVIIPLMEEITGLIRGKTAASQIGALWLRHLVQIHSGLLTSNPELPTLLGPVLGCIENRLSLQTPLSRLKGRINLLVSQLTAPSNDSIDEEPLLTYNEEFNNLDENEIEMDQVESESDNEWMDDEDDDDENENGGELENGINDSSDEMMSS